MDPVEIIEQDGWTCEIHQDIEPMSPDEWDNLATFVHTTDYAFGESQRGEWDRFGDRTREVFIRALSIFGDDVAAVLPVQITEHGPQVSVYETSTDNANGVLYTTHRRLNELCGEEPKYHSREWATEALRGELTTWRQYLEGDVYGVVVKGPDSETYDSCWGFYGSEYAEQEGREMLAAAIANEAKTVEDISRITSL
jgi:hypothetical protein